MEIIKIQTSHNLVTSVTDNRAVEEHSYPVNCRQYLTTYQSWQRHKAVETKSFGIMTLDYERIWVTEAEGRQIADAIQSARSPFKLE